jgi:hypothetical protein
MRRIDLGQRLDIEAMGSSFIALPVFAAKKVKKKCCKKYKNGKRCKKCPGQKVDK